jgi:hypothetical protein
MLCIKMDGQGLSRAGEIRRRLFRGLNNMKECPKGLQLLRFPDFRA